MAIQLQKGGSTENRQENFSVELDWQIREDSTVRFRPSCKIQ